ncbi:glycosyltransferase family 2 protein [Serratia plymuthica]|uniref:glycosyltransferase family 2 protein n=1 Tax=Serratia plymuthica TaxID=82996 RepID=UPI001F530D62|nr:glycosyltransferase family 2 protein [Serratia plymuthica]UNK27404.1 glycosyltransferase family 2 protein [Serratia plymuthica]
MSVTVPFSPCIVIPCFNHGQMMADVLASLAGYSLPCLVVDDGSTAATADELQRLAAELPWVQLLRLEQNQGKGAAVIAGLQWAHRQGHSHALQVDADGQHQLSDIPDMIAEAHAHPECLISGQPVYDSSVPKARLYGRYITHVWVWIETLSLSLKDSMCGFRVYPVEPTLALAASHPLGKRMDFDTEVMVRLYWQGVPSRFLPTRVTYPADGVSHFDTLRDNLRISWMHTRLFFGMLPRIPRLLRRKPARSLHWSATEERHGLWGIRLMLQVYRLFGRRAFQLLLYPVIGYFWLTGRAQREASRDYLQRLRGFAQGRQRALPVPLNSFRHFMRFGDAMLDKLASWRGELHDIQLVDRAGFERQIASGQGTLILASHLGDIESCRALGELDASVKVNALVFTEHAERFNQVMKEVNPRANLNLIQVTSLGPETAMRLQDKLNAGEWVAIVGDRTSAGKHQRGERPRVVWSHLLGKPAPFPQGPFVLAAALRCPVFLMFGLKQQGRLNLYFESFADPLLLPRDQRHQALQQAVDNYAARLEHYCLLAPLDWFNFFDFWQLAARPSAQQEPET